MGISFFTSTILRDPRLLFEAVWTRKTFPARSPKAMPAQILLYMMRSLNHKFCIHYTLTSGGLISTKIQGQQGTKTRCSEQRTPSRFFLDHTFVAGSLPGLTPVWVEYPAEISNILRKNVTRTLPERFLTWPQPYLCLSRKDQWSF